MSPEQAKAIFDFEGLRKRLGFNQAEMAHRMSLGSRTYFSLETEPSAISARHIKLAELVGLETAVERGDPSLAPKRVGEVARRFSDLTRREEEPMSNRETTLRVRAVISDFERQVEIGKMSGKELAQHILSIALALRNAIEELDARTAINEIQMTTLPVVGP
jgi:DNA-binding XRE family transcriptional regulator